MLLTLNSVFHSLMVCSFSSAVAPNAVISYTYRAKKRAHDSGKITLGSEAVIPNQKSPKASANR